MRRLILLLLITTAINTSAAPLETGLVDDSSPVLDYVGAWSSGTYVDAYGGGYQSTNDIAASLSFETFATGITIFFIYDSLGDDIEVCVDTDCIIVSTVGAVSVGKIELTNLASALKTVTVAKTTADASVFLFDAIYIHPSGESMEVAEQSIQFDYDGQAYSGILDLRISSGEALIIILMAGLLSIQLFNLILGFWKQ